MLTELMTYADCITGRKFENRSIDDLAAKLSKPSIQNITKKTEER